MLQAQHEEIPNAIGIRGALVNYDYPIKQDFSDIDFTAGAEIEYIRHISGALNLSVPFKVAKGHLPIDAENVERNVSLLSLDLLLQLKMFKGESAVYPFLFSGVSGVYEDMRDFGMAIPAGVGVNIKLAPFSYFTIKGEYRLGLDDFRDNVQLSAGFVFLIGGRPDPEVPDRDGDGIPDLEDICPDVPGELLFNGCPDTDRDGVGDSTDECPTIPGIKAMKGCPDSDNDGIKDSDDDCPNERGLPENNGCPEKDADQDGVPDETDICPNDPGPVALNGCPDKDGDETPDRIDKCPEIPGPKISNGCPDGDNDGVLDDVDRCPTSPGPASNNGCPEIKEEVKEVLEFATQAVQFETGSALLKSESYAVLDKIVKILRDYKDYNLKIGGHTDSIGSSTKNQQLSEQRAKACYEYITSKGIRKSRVNYAGYGEKEPIADNRFKNGRELNRRVEFDVYLK